MPNVKVGQHCEIRRPQGVGRSTFTVVAIERDKVIVHGETRRTIKLSTFVTHPKQYRLLKDVN